MQSRKLPLATGLTYHVLEWDGPGDLTFVLVHGFSDLGYGWSEVAPRLAQHGHVIAPDLPTALALLEGLGPADLTEHDGPIRTAAWIDAWRVARSRPRPMASLDEAVGRLRRNDDQLGEA